MSDDLIERVTKEIRGNELKILDDFARAFFASESLTGKDLIGIIKNFELQMRSDFENGAYVNKYKYVPIVKEDEEKDMSDWQPIETIPKDGTEILAWCENEYRKGVEIIKWCHISLSWNDLNGKWSWNSSSIKGWMPIPGVPKKKHSCGCNPLWVELIGKDLILYHYNHRGKILHRIIDFCPFCGAKADE